MPDGTPRTEVPPEVLDSIRKNGVSAECFLVLGLLVALVVVAQQPVGELVRTWGVYCLGRLRQDPRNAGKHQEERVESISWLTAGRVW